MAAIAHHSNVMPEGPRRDLVFELERLRELAGNPAVRKIATLLDNHPSRPTISDAFKGTASGGGGVPTWDTVRAIAAALVRQVRGASTQFNEDSLKQLWARARDEFGAVEPARPRLLRDTGSPAPNTAEAFARTTFGWASEVHREKHLGMPNGVQGAAAISMRGLGLEACRRAFDAHMHYALDRFCDQHFLTPASTSVAGQYRFGPSSVSFHGPIRKVTDVRGVLAIEVSAFGAVAVYFRMPGRGATTEVAAKSLLGAMMTAFQVTNFLDWNGSAYAATLLDVFSMGVVAPIHDKRLFSSDPFWDPNKPSHPSLLWQNELFPTYHGPFDVPVTARLNSLIPSGRFQEIAKELTDDAIAAFSQRFDPATGKWDDRPSA